MLDQDQIDIMMKEIEEADGNVQFISMSAPEQLVDDRNFAQWFWNEITKFFWLR